MAALGDAGLAVLEDVLVVVPVVVVIAEVVVVVVVVELEPDRDPAPRDMSGAGQRIAGLAVGRTRENGQNARDSLGIRPR